jgi:excisionase family DNA binding protein
VSALLTVDEAAAELRCKRRRVFELLADNTLVRGPKYGRQTVITAESVAAALAAECHTRQLEQKPTAKRRAPKAFKADLDALAERQRAEWKKRRPNTIASPDSRYQSTEPT